MGELIRFLRSSDLRTIIAALGSRDVHPAIQFLKYALCGVAALVLHTTIFFTLSATINPALSGNMPDDSTRANHALANNAAAFFFSNALVYWLNTRWVFTSGRHHPIREFLLFTLVNAPGAIGGSIIQDWLIRSAGWPTWAAFAGFVLPNVLINFACRKFFIFQR
jgi:putative flippase GtrA